MRDKATSQENCTMDLCTVDSASGQGQLESLKTRREKVSTALSQAVCVCVCGCVCVCVGG